MKEFWDVAEEGAEAVRLAVEAVMRPFCWAAMIGLVFILLSPYMLIALPFYVVGRLKRCLTTTPPPPSPS